jgi:hypothetical protein
MSGELITQETVQTLIDGGKSIAKVASGAASELMDEAIRLFIFSSILGVLRVAAVFIVFLIVKKYLDAAMEVSKDKELMFKALKTTALVASIIYFTAASYPHLQNIGKAMVSPQIFLLEKANELRK